MALQNLVGTGLWMPTPYKGFDSNNDFAATDVTLDADEEEVQIIGSVHIEGGGSKTFGTSGSKLSWLAGASVTFAANSTLRVGVKGSSVIDTANGPVARATVGAAAFSVYDDLVGGTDTITSSTWRDDTMSAGTPFTVADGDLIALCFHLDTTSGTPSVKISSGAVVASTFAIVSLVTSGPTYTAQNLLSNTILTFDDGSLGWVTPTYPFSVVDGVTGTIGNGNIFANVFRVPFACKIDALAAGVNPTTNAANFSLQLYSTPLGTPGLVAEAAHDANVTAQINTNRLYVRRFATPQTLSINTDYAIGVKQTTATAVATLQVDVSDAAHFKARGMGAECYAANSTAGATFAAQNSGRRRYHVFARVSALDDGVGGGGGNTVNRALLHSGVSAVG